MMVSCILRFHISNLLNNASAIRVHDKGCQKALPEIEKFAKLIIIPRTGDGNPDRFVHCTNCDDFAYCRVGEDEISVIRVNYYCKKCVSKFLIALNKSQLYQLSCLPATVPV